MRCRPVEDEVAPTQADGLGDPQPGRDKQLKQRPPLRWYLVEQPHELRPRQKAPLARRPCTAGAPARQHDLLGGVGIQQAFGDRCVKREAQRRERVGDRAVTQPPGATGAGREPIHEVLHRGAIEIAHPDLAIKVAQREVDQQATVFAARVRAHAVVPSAGVAIKPRETEPVQRRAAAQCPRFAVALDLDGPSLGQRAGVLLALTTLDAVDHHVPGTTPVDARRIRPLEGQLAHCCPVAPGVATQRRSPPAAHPLQHWNSRARPRGFEPLTFGSVESMVIGRQKLARNSISAGILRTAEMTSCRRAR